MYFYGEIREEKRNDIEIKAHPTFLFFTSGYQKHTFFVRPEMQ